MTATGPGRTPPPSWLVKGTAPLAKVLAGRAWFPIWGVVHDVGRRSGRRYAVPVALVPVVRADIVLIGLPWGSGTNWTQNVLAAGQATLTWKGRDWLVDGPRLAGVAEATAITRAPLRWLVARGGSPRSWSCTWRADEASGSSRRTGRSRAPRPKD